MLSMWQDLFLSSIFDIFSGVKAGRTVTMPRYPQQLQRSSRDCSAFEGQVPTVGCQDRN